MRVLDFFLQTFFLKKYVFFFSAQSKSPGFLMSINAAVFMSDKRFLFLHFTGDIREVKQAPLDTVLPINV